MMLRAQENTFPGPWSRMRSRKPATRSSPRPTNPVARRLEYIRTREHIPSLKGFWKRLGEDVGSGASYETVRAWHHDRTASVEYLTRVLQVFPWVSARWLLTGEGPRESEGLAREDTDESVNERERDAFGVEAELYASSVPPWLHGGLYDFVYDAYERWPELRPADALAVRRMLERLFRETMCMRETTSPDAGWRQQAIHHAELAMRYSMTREDFDDL